MTAETSADRPISRFEVPKIDDLPADIAERIRQVEDKTGFVPNVFLALGHRPEEWRAFFAYHDALMDKETPALSKADRELSKAELDARQRAMLDVAVKLATSSVQVSADDLDRLRAHGFTDDDIWDIGSITGLFALSNRIAHLAAIPPNDEFYLMGRTPRD